MREILFRGRTTQGKEWVSGYYAKYSEGHFIGAHNSYGTMLWFEVDPETVGQFTGLTDKNGKKIFEGDILRYWSNYHKRYIYQGVVDYGNFNCSCCDGVYGWFLDGGDVREINMYDICGNIHDNPELLEV